MSEQYNTTPSSLLHIEDPYTGWCLDEAIYTWGMYVRSELSKATEGEDDQKKAERKFNSAWNQIFDQDKKPGAEQMFRDPMDSIGRK